jgi:hypothetical protein
MSDSTAHDGCPRVVKPYHGLSRTETRPTGRVCRILNGTSLATWPNPEVPNRAEQLSRAPTRVLIDYPRKENTPGTLSNPRLSWVTLCYPPRTSDPLRVMRRHFVTRCMWMAMGVGSELFRWQCV